jgi:hypothetical protein
MNDQYKEHQVDINDIIRTNPFNVVLPTSFRNRTPTDPFNNKTFTIKQFEYQKNFQRDYVSPADGTPAYTPLFGVNNPLKLVTMDVANPENWTIDKSSSNLLSVLYPCEVLRVDQFISTSVPSGNQFVIRYEMKEETSFLITNNVFQIKLAIVDMNNNVVNLANGSNPEVQEFFYIKACISES